MTDHDDTTAPEPDETRHTKGLAQGADAPTQRRARITAVLVRHGLPAPLAATAAAEIEGIIWGS